MIVKVRRIDFSPDEWIAGTVGLTLEEGGLYILICALIWSRGKRITYEHLKGATPKTHGNKLNALLVRLEVLGKIVRNGQEIGQSRAEAELENAEKRIGNARENGAKGGRANGLAKAVGSRKPKSPENTEKPLGNASETDQKTNRNPIKSITCDKLNYQLSTINHHSEAGASVAGATTGRPPADATRSAVELTPDDAARQCGTLWDRGIAVLGEDPAARSLIGKMRKEHGDLAVIDAIIACESAAPSDPIAYLRACLARSQTNARRRSPNEKLFAGFAQAAGDCRPDWPLADPFLVTGRCGTDP